MSHTQTFLFTSLVARRLSSLSLHSPTQNPPPFTLYLSSSSPPPTILLPPSTTFLHDRLTSPRDLCPLLSTLHFITKALNVSHTHTHPPSSLASIPPTTLVAMTALSATHLQIPVNHSRLSLLSEYLSLDAPEPAKSPAPSPKVASRIAARITLARSMHLSESPSEASLVDKALQRCKSLQTPQLQSIEDPHRTQARILSKLYPAHPSLDPLNTSLSRSRHRASVLRKALREQNHALSKLSDAANLLLLISDHINILVAGHPNSCHSSTSSSDVSHDDDARRGCLFGSDYNRAHIYLTTLPPNYRIRYLRKCWGFAADALSTAVDHSAFLSKQLDREGQTELVPGILDRSRPSLSLFELPGGLTFMLRPDSLRKMGNDAKTMRDTVFDWQMRQRKYLLKLNKDLAKANKSVVVHEARLADARRRLLAIEFADVVSS